VSKKFAVVLVAVVCATSLAAIREALSEDGGKAPAAKPLPPIEVAKKEPVDLKTVDKQIAGMNGVLEKLLKEAQKAREKNDIRTLNCLLVKINLQKGLIKAASRARLVLLEAKFAEDPATASAYAEKIRSYRQSTEEIEKSMDECGRTGTTGEGTTFLYIRPEGVPETDLEETTPWDWEEETAPDEQYPVIPPASPFR